MKNVIRVVKGLTYVSKGCGLKSWCIKMYITMTLTIQSACHQEFYAYQQCCPLSGQELCIYVHQALWTAYLQLHHDHPMSGHLDFHKVLHKLRVEYYWEEMWQSVLDHLRNCQVCQSIKPPPQQSGLLTSISVSEPFELIGWDLIGPFPTTPDGTIYIIEIMEYLTWWCEAVAIPDGFANTIANVLLK